MQKYREIFEGFLGVESGDVVHDASLFVLKIGRLLLHTRDDGGFPSQKGSGLQ